MELVLLFLFLLDSLILCDGWDHFGVLQLAIPGLLDAGHGLIAEVEPRLHL